MASIRKKTSPNGLVIWQSRWREPGLDGKDRQRTKNFPNARDAKAHAAKVEQEIERRGVGDPNRQSTEQYLRGWVALLERRGEHSPSTLAGYKRHIGLAARQIGTVPLEKLSAADLDRAYITLLKSGGTKRSGPRSAETRTPRPLKARSVLHVHRMLHTALEQARKWKLISENPARDATAPSPGKTAVRAFTEDEVKRLLAAAAHDREMTIVVSLLLVTGLRRSELLGLAWDCVDLDGGTITVRRAIIEVDRVPVLREQPKSDAGWRTIGISSAVADLMRAQKAHGFETALAWGKGYTRDPFYCFPGWGGQPMVPMSMTLRLRKIMRQAGVTGIQPVHGWRHTSATLLIDAGENLKTVQTRLGHSTPAITMALYVHPVDERDRAAAERLGALLPKSSK